MSQTKTPHTSLTLLDHQDPTRVEIGGNVVHPIACRRVIGARLRDETPPACSWERDPVAGYRCTAADCGRWIGPGMARHGELAGLFGDESAFSAKELDETNVTSIESEVAAHAAKIAETTGVPVVSAVLRASALLLIAARRL